VRIKRSDFDAVVEAGYRGPPAAPPPAGIWEGDVPPPETTGGGVPFDVPDE
jgi:hypothetical protein